MRLISLSAAAKRLNCHHMDVYHSAMRRGVRMTRRGGKCYVPLKRLPLIREGMTALGRLTDS